jgi:hypothetical protein
MKRIVFLLIILMVMSFRVSAQDETPQYRLRVPTEAEYLSIVPSFAEQYIQETGGDLYRSALFNVPELEIKYRYPDLYRQDYQQIADAFAALASTFPQMVDWQFWNDALVLSWITANSVDLSAETELTFDEFDIQINQQDLDGDDSPEFVLYVGGSFGYRGYLVLAADNQGYRSVPHPLPYGAGGEFRYDFSINSSLMTLGYQDVNGNGIVDWLVQLSNADDGSTSANAGQLYILEWQDSALVNLGDENLVFYQSSNAAMSWSFVNRDEDDALEIEQYRSVVDNWGCAWTEITLFDWNGDTFSEAAPEQEFPQTSGCFTRQAETAIWEGRVEDAVALYELIPRTTDLVVTLADEEGTMTRFDAINLGNYTDIRLALAYMLIGREDEGLALLRSLQTLPEHDQSFPEYVELLLNAYAANPTAVGVCMAAYDFVLFNGYYFDREGFLVVGLTIDNAIYDTQGMYIPPPAPPVTAGCDAPTLVSQIIGSHTFSTSELPAEQLEVLGISTAFTFQTDLNQDGQAEWLVWATSLIAPIFFAPDGEIYVVSRVGISGDSLGDYNELATWELPDGLGLALVNLDFAEHFRQSHAGYGLGGGPDGCPNPIERGENARFPDNPGRLTVWRLVDHELVLLVDASMCERVSVSEIFSADSRSLNVWIFDDYQYTVPAIYTWDSGQQTYVAPPPLPTPTAPPTDAIVTYTPSLYDLAYYAQNEFTNGNYQAVVEYLAEGLTLDEPVTKLLPLQYLGAMAYEALNRPDEALAQYVSIYEAAPESSWGQLAAVHLERIE